jgi:hypothetical protein
MNIIYINPFSVCLWDRDGNGTSRILDAQIIADDALPGTKCLFEYVSCNVVARIGRIHLNKLMGTTGRAQNVGCSGNEVVTRATFCIHYFECILSADCAE